MIKVQFISVNTLKDKSVLQQNVDEKILNLAIREFQELELKKTLGKTEYNRLQDVIIASLPPTDPIVALTSDDKELMEYVLPVMIYGSLMYSISPIHRKLTNAGVQSDKLQNSVADDLAAARADYAFKMDGYKRELLEFIQGRSTSTDLTKCETVADTTFNFTGMSLPDRESKAQEHYENSNYKTGGGAGYII